MSDFTNKQRHELALAWATSVFNQSIKDSKALDVAPLEEQLQSFNNFYELYIFAYRECSNWLDSDFNCEIPEE